jgi:four helix bundle protein
MKREVFDKNPILKLSFEFSLQVIDYCEVLESQRKYVLARQLLKSGTSIGANAMESQNAESKADFIHKMKIAAKEAEESQYWLWLCDFSQNIRTANI